MIHLSLEKAKSSEKEEKSKRKKQWSLKEHLTMDSE